MSVFIHDGQSGNAADPYILGGLILIERNHVFIVQPRMAAVAGKLCLLDPGDSARLCPDPEVALTIFLNAPDHVVVHPWKTIQFGSSQPADQAGCRSQPQALLAILVNRSDGGIPELGKRSSFLIFPSDIV